MSLRTALNPYRNNTSQAELDWVRKEHNKNEQRSTTTTHITEESTRKEKRTLYLNEFPSECMWCFVKF
jgi:hypothetical protein